MPGDRRPRKQPHLDDRLGTARLAAVIVFLSIFVFLALTDVLGRLFRDANFRVDGAMFGLVVGGLITLLGLDGVQRVVNRAVSKDDTSDEEEGS